MDTNNLALERRNIGLALHQAETAIGIGKRTVRELTACEPVDEALVGQHLTKVTEARLARNALRGQLEAVKQQQLASANWYGWSKG